MTQINLIVNSMPRDLTEFVFFLIVGFTAGSMGFIQQINYLVNLTSKQKIFFHKTQIESIVSTGNSNFDLPLNSNNSTTVSKPETSFPFL